MIYPTLFDLMKDDVEREYYGMWEEAVAIENMQQGRVIRFLLGQIEILTDRIGYLSSEIKELKKNKVGDK